MAAEVDYPKSIEKQKLVYKITGGVIVDYIASYFLILIFSLISSVPILAAVTGQAVSLWLVLCSSSFLIFIVCSIIYRDAFVVIKDGNKEKMLTVLNKFYEDLVFQVDDEKMLISTTPTGSPIWGRAITVLCDGDTTYLNITSLGKGQSPTFVHGLLNYFKACKIAKYYNSF